MPSYEGQTGDDSDNEGGNGLNNPNNLDGYGLVNNRVSQQDRQGNYGDANGNPIPGRPSPPPSQFIGPAAPKFEAKQLGGSPTGNYQTQSPNYSDLTAKHQAGFSDSETGETQTPNMFNFNGTVYSYNPENSAFTDTYTGTEITSDNGETGSQGIAGIYGPGGGKPYERNMGGLEAVDRPTAEELQRVNPEWTQYQEDLVEAEAVAARTGPNQAPGETRKEWITRVQQKAADEREIHDN